MRATSKIAQLTVLSQKNIDFPQTESVLPGFLQWRVRREAIPFVATALMTSLLTGPVFLHLISEPEIPRSPIQIRFDRSFRTQIHGPCANFPSAQISPRSEVEVIGRLQCFLIGLTPYKNLRNVAATGRGMLRSGCLSAKIATACSSRNSAGRNSCRVHVSMLKGCHEWNRIKCW